MLSEYLETENQVPNNAGGLVYETDVWNRLMRFLIIGTEGGTFYVNEKTHVTNNVQALDECLNTDPVRAIRTIEEVSDSGRAPKNDYAIFALARAASHGNESVRRLALSRLPAVCRTGTHLLMFVNFVDKQRGWGSGLRKAVADWYLSKSANQLAYQVLKYQNREGWTHRDVFRKVHPVTNDYSKNTVIRYVTKGSESLTEAFDDIRLIVARETAFQYNDPKITAGLIREAGLSREMIPTEHMNEKIVQEALAEKMPYTALMRNLGNLTRHGVIAPNKWETLEIARRLNDDETIKKSRVHPISILTALRTYDNGRGFRGKGEWEPQHQITAALDEAFYKAFQNVEPTGKRFLVGLDVSGSMSMPYGSGVLSPAQIGAALVMMLVRTEPFVQPMAFANDFRKLDITARDSLNDVLRKTSRMNFGGTDANLPMQYALQNNIPVDVFVVITDNETWMRGSPADTLRKYRRKMGIDAKLVVLATEATHFTIADPRDRGMLDIAGFDTAVPDIIRQFALGEL